MIHFWGGGEIKRASGSNNFPGPLWGGLLNFFSSYLRSGEGKKTHPLFSPCKNPGKPVGLRLERGGGSSSESGRRDPRILGGDELMIRFSAFPAQTDLNQIRSLLGCRADRRKKGRGKSF